MPFTDRCQGIEYSENASCRDGVVSKALFLHAMAHRAAIWLSMAFAPVPHRNNRIDNAPLRSEGQP